MALVMHSHRGPHSPSVKRISIRYRAIGILKIAQTIWIPWLGIKFDSRVPVKPFLIIGTMSQRASWRSSQGNTSCGDFSPDFRLSATIAMQYGTRRMFNCRRAGEIRFPAFGNHHQSSYLWFWRRRDAMEAKLFCWSRNEKRTFDGIGCYPTTGDYSRNCYWQSRGTNVATAEGGRGERAPGREF